jgi:hypothetical protein
VIWWNHHRLSISIEGNTLPPITLPTPDGWRDGVLRSARHCSHYAIIGSSEKQTNGEIRETDDEIDGR